MTKELLSSWGVDFDPVNIEGNDDALREMIALGANLAPVVAAAGGMVQGWNPGAVAALVGVPYADVPRLNPAQLAARLDEILALAQQALRQTPEAQLALEGPGRRRTLRQLAYHAFRLSAAFVDAMEQDGLEEAWLQEEAPPGLRTGPDLAAFGDAVRARLTRWFAQAPPETYRGTAYTYYGEQSVHALLERTCWHAGQHMRQAYDLLERHGVLPPGALDPAVFHDLPLPRAVW
jgi:hypothetical protein